MNKEDMFWTDYEQAIERIQGSVVCYDGEPVYVERIHPPGEDPGGIVKATIRPCDPIPTAVRKRLDSPKFKRFRELPNLGWMNPSDPKTGALFLYRRSVRTRVHGLNRNNVTVRGFPVRSIGGPGGFLGAFQTVGDGAFDTYMYDSGFKQMHHGQYPSLANTLSVIRDSSAIAFSNKFCVVCDEHGVKWLFRDRDRVGIFGGVDTLLLLKKFAYLREEIMAEPRFTLNQIREL
jgi:hypothetical protein